MTSETIYVTSMAADAAKQQATFHLDQRGLEVYFNWCFTCGPQTPFQVTRDTESGRSTLVCAVCNDIASLFDAIDFADLTTVLECPECIHDFDTVDSCDF